MFKKTKIAAALLAIVAGNAQAVNVNPEGTGQVLIFPYYNTNNNFVTAFSITNTTPLFKAVKVRFRESKDSNDVLDFNVYMSPYDVWTGTIRNNPATNVANIITTDESCTYPDKTFLQAGQDFLDVYSNVDSADLSEGYVEVIEMGVLADGPATATGGFANDSGMWTETGQDGTADGSPTVLATEPVGTTIATAANNVTYNIDHNTTGKPRNCGVITTAWDRDNGGQTPASGFSSGALSLATAGQLATTGGVAVEGGNPALPYGDGNSTNNGLVAPTGGLTGFSILLDLTTGAAFVADATVIDNYSTVPQHFRPNDAGSDTVVGNYPINPGHFLLPSLASGNVRYSIVPESLLDGVDSASDADGIADSTMTTWPLTHADTGALLSDTFFDGGSRVLQQAGANPLPMAAVLSVTAVSNTYLIDESINAATDWIVTMPMKKHGIYTGRTFRTKNTANSTAATFSQVNASKFLPLNKDPEGDLNWVWAPNSTGDAVVNLSGYYDNEEQQPAPGAANTGFSPSLPGQANSTVLAREVNVLSFSTGTSTSLLGSPNATTFTLAPGFLNGWARINFDSSYNYNASSQLDALIAANDGNDDPSQAGDTIPLSATGDNSYRGVPAIGFAAIAADGTIGKAGETIPHTRWQDRK